MEDESWREDADDLGEDDNDADGDDMEILHPDHPAMQRVQRALEAQLKQRQQEVSEELADQNNNLKQETKRREQLGVELYGVQQQLAALQARLENAADGKDVHAERRAAVEQALHETQQLHDQINKELKAKRSAAEQAQREFDELRSQVIMFEQHADELSSEVKGAKRAALKANRDQDKIEQAKQEQDLFVDRLRERLKELEREIVVKKKQKEAQAEETASARDALREAQAEIDEIVMRRKEVTSLWQASQQGLTKRNEALANMQQQAREQQQELFAKQLEVEGLERLVRQAQERHEQLSAQLTRLQNEYASQKKKLEALLAKQDEVQQEYTVVSKALQQVEEQLARHEQQINIRTSELNMARDKVDRLSRDQVALEERLVGHMQDKLTVDAAGRNVGHRIQGVRKQIAEQEALLAEAENTVARHNLTANEHEADIEQMEETRRELVKNEQALGQEVETAEKDMKQNYIFIERKQSQIDRLNKRIGTLRARLAEEGAGNEDLSPAQIEVSNYRREINATIEENNVLQGRWLSRQSELVAQERRLEAEQKQLDELRTKHQVLSERQYRLDAETEQRRGEIRDQERLFKQLQNELVKLNTLVTSNRGKQEDLQQNHQLMEADFVRQLREEEALCVHLQSELQQIEEERTRLLNAVVEAERQLLLWEKKIQLAKETKAELNQNEGADELNSMRGEIHRMTLRLAQLDRQKEELIKEMERSVDRRGTIGSKARLAAKKGQPTSQTVQKEVLELKRKVKQAIADARHAQENIAEADAETEAVQRSVEEYRQETAQLSSQYKQLQERVMSLHGERQQNLETLVHHQDTIKYFEGVEAGRQRRRYKDPEVYPSKLEAQENKLQALHGVVDYMLNIEPEARPMLESIKSLIGLQLQVSHKTI
ncbi:uncharacterized protein MONBRDRAFT_32563 [Monosiga brevicollis MX1]|uniref:Coiled-coil domain-containing protein 40 n=1 Tax=Monosiga brevicollis TaxID=81824 RepID=A9V0C2_MONBE|nr:uncharacterized protein MONBRDRAFT_32563 [Monosiga brevicollis MX1]EDQ89132.1 predicted protein [Monosiga brevicollis MX1]|eukprot:XP_001746237.1 hypothetical protein [Monosiga brevicollis MX1]